MSIKETLERFDEKFLTNPKSRMCYLSGDEKRELVKFVEEEIKQTIKEIVPEKAPDSEECFGNGFNYAIDQFNLNVNKYFEV